MRLTLIVLCLLLVLSVPARADTLFLPIIRGGYVVMVTGVARWEGDLGPVAHCAFALLEVVCEDPFLVFRHTSQSPRAWTGAEGRFAFQDVEDGVYVLAIETHPPFGWALLWHPDEWTLYLVVVEGESVEMGVVRVGAHLRGE